MFSRANIQGIQTEKKKHPLNREGAMLIAGKAVDELKIKCPKLNRIIKK